MRKEPRRLWTHCCVVSWRPQNSGALSQRTSHCAEQPEEPHNVHPAAPNHSATGHHVRGTARFWQTSQSRKTKRSNIAQGADTLNVASCCSVMLWHVCVEAGVTQMQPNTNPMEHDGAARRWLLRRWECVPSLREYSSHSQFARGYCATAARSRPSDGSADSRIRRR